MHSKPVENDTNTPAKKRFEQALARLEQSCEALIEKNQQLQTAKATASEELALHIRNLGRILERQE